MESNPTTIAASSEPTYRVSKGETITAWIVSALIRADFPGVAAPAEDRVDYRFLNGFVEVGDLPCRKAFWAEMVGRAIEPERNWPEARLNLPGANRRVEFTGFWHTPTHVRRWLKGTFRCQTARKLNLRLSTCGGVRIWVNGTEQVRFKPFQRNVESACDLTLALEAGDNDILLHTEDLAERDTIWFFELELLDEASLTVVLPIALDQEEVGRLAALARDVRPSQDVFVDEALEVIFDTPPGRDLPVLVEVVSHGHDSAVLARAEVLLGAHETRLSIPGTRGLPDGYHAVRLTIGSGAGTITRVIDAAFLSQTSPGAGASSIEVRKRTALAYSARFGAERIGRALAMLAAGDDDKPTIDRIFAATLHAIGRREDCSDFVMVPLLWLLRGYGRRLAPEIAEKIRQTVLGYRYWIDEPGNDVMWFWSENHVLCFHVSQLLAGECLPDALFTASGRTGRQQAELATARLSRWFDAVEAHGLAEWNSAAYYPIDFIGLMALEHWAEPDLAARASHQLDLVFEMIALHTLAGVPAGSQGRAYDKELRAGPLTELAPFAEVAFGEGWLNGGVASLPMFCCSNYAPPAHLKGFARLEPGRAIEARYAQGLDAGKLVLFKNQSAQLSTVVDHKTGRKGHQQHVIDIRLSGHPMARLWVNHPGEDDPWGTQRPSYWAGSGMLPRVAQHRDLALMIFDTQDHRNGWTHAYLGRDGLDEVLIEDKWLLVRSGAGFAALHATNGLEMMEKGATAGREIRSEGRRSGWIAAVSCGDPADFERFRERIIATAVDFDADRLMLSVTPPDRPELRLAYEGTFSVGGQPMTFDHTQPRPEITFDSAAPGRDPAPLFYS
ncbi:hypothetical protein [Sinorhizobium alkalisoli]|uniref:hypothetical protein n=1 Tax=Sinorhizobium alkalisoli TaxID=1752398 RepID=UPI00124F0DF7|nr:hypothetical protein [Sinorhizobium alkalisoli]QFI69134.1 hypothetical protein EKH55_4260 [Sinorhizobium alkalisoli]